MIDKNFSENFAGSVDSEYDVHESYTMEHSEFSGHNEI